MNYSSGSISGATLTSQPQAVPRLTAISSGLDRLQNVLGDATMRTRMLADRLIGPQPEKVSDNRTEPNPTTAVRSLELSVEVITNLADSLSAHLARLETL